ncbi:S49 family peptidase [Paraburkholderia phosphatilytica]|uniref:S49 family peptidase n=1 Tax=Paraburkholderia phosphatilytica TaxID=2282883 RepID=UPI000E552FBB|nr:S49 family peptidase [Paraburkholderia phosphatilytica]
MNHLIAEFINTPWAIEPRRLSIMSAVLARWAAGGHAGDDVMAAAHADRAATTARRGEASRAGGNSIAVLPLYGTIAQRASAVDDASGTGLMSLDRFTQTFRTMLGDPAVGGILIDIDSPGGSVYGVQELHAEIMAARGKKPVFAVANCVAASAAYWLGTAASEFYVTPSGEVGSIGVFSAHTDMSAALAKQGINTTLVSAGKYKTEGNSFEPLGKDARAALQSRIDGYYASFTRDVARGRAVDAASVRNGFGQGRMVTASDAARAGMVDGVATFDEALSRLQKTASNGGQRTARMGVAAPLRSGNTALLRRELELLEASICTKLGKS